MAINQHWSSCRRASEFQTCGLLQDTSIVFALARTIVDKSAAGRDGEPTRVSNGRDRVRFHQFELHRDGIRCGSFEDVKKLSGAGAHHRPLTLVASHRGPRATVIRIGRCALQAAFEQFKGYVLGSLLGTCTTIRRCWESPSSSLRDSAAFRDLGAATGIGTARLPCNDCAERTRCMSIAADRSGKQQLDRQASKQDHHQRHGSRREGPRERRAGVLSLRGRLLRFAHDQTTPQRLFQDPAPRSRTSFRALPYCANSVTPKHCTERVWMVVRGAVRHREAQVRRAL